MSHWYGPLPENFTHINVIIYFNKISGLRMRSVTWNWFLILKTFQIDSLCIAYQSSANILLFPSTKVCNVVNKMLTDNASCCHNMSAISFHHRRQKLTERPEMGQGVHFVRLLDLMVGEFHQVFAISDAWLRWLALEILLSNMFYKKATNIKFGRWAAVRMKTG